MEVYNAGAGTTDSGGSQLIRVSNWWVWSGDSSIDTLAASLVMKYGDKRNSFKTVSYIYRALPVRNARVDESQSAAQTTNNGQ